MPTMIQLLCPNLACRKFLSVGEETRGKLVRCPSCQAQFKVPSHRPSPAPVAAPTAAAAAGKK